MMEEPAGSNSSLSQLYRYDDNGNRLRLITATSATDAAYDAQDRLATYGTATWTWNDAGHLLTRTSPSNTTSLTYDAFGTLLSATRTDSPNTLTYRNDATGRRVQRTRSTPTESVRSRWLYADGLNPIAELRSQDNAPFALSQTYVYATMPNVPDVIQQGGSTYKVVSDHLGSVRLVVKATGTGACQVVQRIDYDPFGVVTAEFGPGWQPFGFAGGLYDSDSGLVRFGARDYDPSTGRWTSKDPVRFDGGVNLYLYAEGDPVDFVDPTGQWIGVAIGAVIGFGVTSTVVGMGTTLWQPRDPEIDEHIRRYQNDKTLSPLSACISDRETVGTKEPKRAAADHYLHAKKTTSESGTIGLWPFYLGAFEAYYEVQKIPFGGIRANPEFPAADPSWDSFVYGTRGGVEQALIMPPPHTAKSHV